MKRTTVDKAFSLGNTIFFIVLGFIMLFPLLNIITLSLLPDNIASIPGRILLFPNPKDVTFVAYAYILKHDFIIRAFANSVFVSIVGASLGTLLVAMLAYGIADERMPGQFILSKMILFTMMFSGGMIPAFLLVKNLGLLNTLWSLIVPGLVGAYHVMLTRAFFVEFPASLEESARIDGANDIKILFRIVLPLSTPIIATIFLFKLVGHWNDYIAAVLYITKNELKTLQVLLRELLISGSADASGGTSFESIELGHNIKMAVAVVSIVPIVCVYPFLQKYFSKGIMIGAVKG